jgi:hypothetical protein
MTAWMRVEGRLRPVYPIKNHTSPRLRIRFDLSGPELVVYGPDNSSFLTFRELGERRLAAEQQAAESSARAEQSRREAEANRERADRFAARLRELGIDPESLTRPGT